MKKQNLLTALEIVKPGLASKEMIEQSTSFAFINGRVVTYNDEISISHPVEELEISGAVQAEELHKLLNRLKEDEIEVEIKGNEFLLESGRTKAGLTLQEEIKLPLEEIGETGRWKTIPEDFLKYVRRAMATCSNDMSRPVLTCVHVNTEGIIEGSDGFRITHCQLGNEMPVKTFLLPASAAVQVVQIEPMQIAIGNGWIHFRTEKDTILSCRVFEDKFPDTSSFMKVEGVEITLPKQIDEILERAAVFAKRDHFLDESVTITIENKHITVSSKSDAGWFTESARIRYNDSPITFSITPYLLQDILKETKVCMICENRLKFEGAGWEHITTLRGDVK